MLPVIYRFTFETPLAKGLLYLFGLGIAAYAARSGWLNASGRDAKGNPTEPTPQDRLNRALIYGVVGVVIAFVGFYYALPEVPFIGKGKGEGIPIHTYGVLVGSGFICAVTVAAWLAVREWPGELGLARRNQIFDLAFYLFIGAMVGSRVLFIIVNWKDYAAQPSKIFDLGGGLVFYGGLIGASLTSFWYARANGIEFLRLADIAMPTVSLGQALGRLGCFSAGCCWGDVTVKSPLAVSFPGEAAKNLFGGSSNTPSLAFSSMHDSTRWVDLATGVVTDQAAPGAVRVSEWVIQHGHTLPVHPTQLYESLGQTVLFVALLTMRKFRRFHGQIFGMWLMCYAVLRTSVELFRGDAERGTLHGLLQDSLGLTSLAQSVPLGAWYNISTSQFISLCLFSLGAWVLSRGARTLRSTPELQVALT